MSMIPSELLYRADKELRKIGYSVECLNCGVVFFKDSMYGVKVKLSTGEWNLEKPMDWYVEAAAHWVKEPSHAIVVFIEIEEVAHVHFSLTGDWEQKAIMQGISKADMMKELEALRNQK